MKAESKTSLPIYGSMTQCAKATGLPVELQKDAKKAGCEAFRAHRVSLEELLKWLGPRTELNEPDGVTQRGARTELDHVRAKRENLKYLRETRELVRVADVQHCADVAFSELFGTLDRIFCSELPPALIGLNEIQLRDTFRAEIDKLKVEVKGKLFALAEEQPEDQEALI